MWWVDSEINYVIEELYESILQKHQEELEESMRGSNFYFNSVDLLYYHFQKTSLSRKGSSYIDSSKCQKNKKNNNESKILWW